MWGRLGWHGDGWEDGGRPWHLMHALDSRHGHSLVWCYLKQCGKLLTVIHNCSAHSEGLSGPTAASQLTFIVTEWAEDTSLHKTQASSKQILVFS